MNLTFKNEKYVGSPCDNHGAFKFSKQQYWTYCRDAIRSEHMFQKTTDKLYFCTGRRYISKRVARFIFYIEDKLELNQEDRVNFTVFENNRSVLMLTNVSKFWSKNTLRRQFFTTLLRCGIIAQKKAEFENYLKTHFRRSYPAAKKFIDGHTKLANRKKLNGWYDTFEYGSEKKLDLLVK